MNRLLSVTAAALFAALAFSGCFGSSDDGFDFTPGKYKETGNTIHLKATVVDLLSHEVAPGMKTNLWAFCFAPFETDDQRSADAIELPAPLPGDAAILHNETFLALGWKCGVPGPTLRVTQGDRVIVEFSHSHFHPHTIHWHGQYVPYLMDGVPGATQDPVEGGGSYKYDFIAKREGTLWYHCHVDTQLHVMQGLYGMMIVEPQSKKYEPTDIDGEFVLVFSSLRAALVEAIGPPHAHPPGCASGFVDDGRGNPCENPPADVTPDIFLMNGHSYPFTEDDPSTAWNLVEGNRYRIRMLNAGVTTEEVHFHGHDVLVTHFDGLPLESPYWADTVVLGPANRVDVVIDADNPGVWVYHTHVNNHETNCGKAPGGMHSSFVYGNQTHEHEFSSELPASCATPQIHLPGDYSDEAVFPIPAEAQQGEVIGTWEFPIEQFCAVKELRLEVVYDPENMALQSFSNLLVVVVNPAGTPVATFRLGGTAGGPNEDYQGQLSGEYRLVREQLTELQQGNYTVQWGVEDGNQALGGGLELSVLVDYHATLDDTKEPHLLYGLPGCPGFT